MVHFVGAGSGAADLITVRGAKLLGEADVVIYAGSWVNPALLDYTKPGCESHDSAKLTLEEVIALIEKAEAEGKTTVRLHTGDSSIYGAVREQFDELEKRDIVYDVCPILPKGSFSPQEISTRFPIEKKAPRNTLFSEYSGEPFSKAYAKSDIRNLLIPSPARQAFRTLLLTGQ